MSTDQRKIPMRQLLRQTARATSLPRPVINAAVSEFVATVTSALARGQSVHIDGLGTFVPSMEAERVVSHPATGERITTPGRLRIRFRMGEALRRLLRPKGDDK